MFHRKRTPQKPTRPTDYPAGTFVKTEKGYFLIATDEKRYRIISERILNSWNPHRIVETTEAAVKKYSIAAKLSFRNGSLIHNLADGKIYLIVAGKRCHIVSPEALERIGSSLDDKSIITVSQDEVKIHGAGKEIS